MDGGVSLCIDPILISTAPEAPLNSLEAIKGIFHLWSALAKAAYAGIMKSQAHEQGGESTFLIQRPALGLGPGYMLLHTCSLISSRDG